MIPNPSRPMPDAMLYKAEYKAPCDADKPTDTAYCGTYYNVQTNIQDLAVLGFRNRPHTS
jgi:hypothetical protein